MTHDNLLNIHGSIPVEYRSPTLILMWAKDFCIDKVSLFFCLTTSHLGVDRDFLTAYCQSSSGDGVDWVRYSAMYGGGLL